MGIVFEQPQPLDPITSIRAGAAGVIEKSLPSMASMYEAAMRARNSGGGGGGGGGNHIGGVQVLPSGDGGALAMVEQQANREQQALNLGFEARHAERMQEGRFQGQRQLMEDAARIQRQEDQFAQQQYGGGQQQPPPQPAPEFSAADKEDLARAQMDKADFENKYSSGEWIRPDDQQAQSVYQGINSKIASLQAKKSKADQFAEQQAQIGQQRALGYAHRNALTELNTMQKYAPGMKTPTGSIVEAVYADGSPKVLKYWDLKTHSFQLHNVPHDPATKTPSDQLQAEKFKHEKELLDQKQEMLKAEAKEKRLIRYREQAEKELTNKYATTPPTHADISKRAREIQRHYEDSLAGRPFSEEPPPPATKQERVATQTPAFNKLLGTLLTAPPAPSVPLPPSTPARRAAAEEFRSLDFSGMGQGQ